jgi:hypothetical protein
MAMTQRNNERGQSLIETAIFFIVLAPLIGMMLGFTHYFQVREKLILASWQGAQLYSSGCIGPGEVQEKIMQFLNSGYPMLPPDRISIRMGSAPGFWATFDQVDQISVTYKTPHLWHRLLNLSQTLEETCYVKHAPHYWDPITSSLLIPRQPVLSGPAYPWRNIRYVYEGH